LGSDKDTKPPSFGTLENAWHATCPFKFPPPLFTTSHLSFFTFHRLSPVPSLRYTIRLLLKSPGFTITAVLILGFGIGANTVIFNLIDTVLLRPLPFPNPDRLVQLFMPTAISNRVRFDYQNYLDFSRAQKTFSSLGLELTDSFALTGRDGTERIDGAYVTASMFQVDRLPFVLGRPFTADEDKPGGPMVAVLGEPFWRSHYNADREIVGKNVTLNGNIVDVVGVVKPESEFRLSPQIYVPINSADVIGNWVGWRERDNHLFPCFGRLKSGVTIAQAQADLELILRDLTQRYPQERQYRVSVQDLLTAEMADYAPTLRLLMAAVGALLILCSANLVALSLSRAIERQREMTIRAAIGASRLSLFWQLLVECAVVSVLSAVVAVPITLAGDELVARISPEDIPRVSEVGFSGGSLIFLAALTLLTALLYGLIPAFNLSKTDVSAAYRGVNRSVTTSAANSRLQSTMIVIQVAVSCVLLVGTGLLLRSLVAAKNAKLGFEPHQLLAAEVYLVNQRYKEPTEARHFFDTLLDRIQHMPGVIDVALNDNPPFNWEDSVSNIAFMLPGQLQPEPGHVPRLDEQVVSPGYFHTMQTPLLAGRDFSWTDGQTGQDAVIINQATAARFFPGQNPIGKRLKFLDSDVASKDCTIIGVVQNAPHSSPDSHHLPFDAYFPYRQQSTNYEVLIVRSSLDPSEVETAIRKNIAAIDGEVPVANVMPYDTMIARHFMTRQLGVFSFSFFSTATVLLAAIGLHGVLTYSLSQRRREIGLRIALGARSLNIVTLVFRQGLGVVLIGCVAGLGLSFSIMHLMAGVLYGVSPTDPITSALAATVLGLAASVACLPPAISAARINPINTLRE
jgi:putative ABC transport system permease protein